MCPYPVRNAPNSDTHALGGINTSLHNSPIIILLLVPLVVVDRVGDTDIELSDDNVEPGSGESVELCLDTTYLAEDKMGLGSNTVDWDTTLLEAADEGNHGVDFAAGAVKVVVVNLQKVRSLYRQRNTWDLHRASQ